jgi:hypothetical protein
VDDTRLREQLLELLEGGHAHVNAERAFAGVRPEHRTARAGDDGHTLWELLEHLRIAQEDILRYTVDPDWTSPEWPEGYWPGPEAPSEEQWRASVASFERDLEGLREIVRDPARDLTAPLSHAPEHTALREVLLAADHNAYHLGQVVEVRRRLGSWD